MAARCILQSWSRPMSFRSEWNHLSDLTETGLGFRLKGLDNVTTQRSHKLQLKAWPPVHAGPSYQAAMSCWVLSIWYTGVSQPFWAPGLAFVHSQGGHFHYLLRISLLPFVHVASRAVTVHLQGQSGSAFCTPSLNNHRHQWHIHFASSKKRFFSALL